MPIGIKPLSEPILTYQVGPVAFSWRQFHRKYSKCLSSMSAVLKKAIKLNQSINQSITVLGYEFENNWLKITITSSRGQWVKSVTTVFNYMSCHQLREHWGPKIRCNEVVGEDRGGLDPPTPGFYPPTPAHVFPPYPFFSSLPLSHFFSGTPQLRFLSPDPRQFFITSPPTPAPLTPGPPSPCPPPQSYRMLVTAYVGIPTQGSHFGQFLLAKVANTFFSF